MVTSTIMKDTGGGSDAIFRPNAIRALCRIIDVGNIQLLLGMELTGPGLYRTKYRARHEDCDCRQKPLRIFGCFDFCLYVFCDSHEL